MLRQKDRKLDREKYEEYKNKMTKNNKKEHKIKVGDQVLVMQKKKNKFTP